MSISLEPKTELEAAVKNLFFKTLELECSTDARLALFEELKALDSKLAQYVRAICKAVREQSYDDYCILVDGLYEEGYSPLVAGAVTGGFIKLLLVSNREHLLADIAHAQYCYSLSLDCAECGYNTAKDVITDKEAVEAAKLQLVLFDFTSKKELGFNADFNLSLYKSIKDISSEFAGYYKLLSQDVMKNDGESYKALCNAFAEGAREALGAAIVSTVLLSSTSEECKQQLVWLRNTSLQKVMFG